jgi:response regulator RpfG family c-di-GMP phosphodiesterase
MSGGADRDRINEDGYWYNKHSEVAEQLMKAEKKLSKLENKPLFKASSNAKLKAKMATQLGKSLQEALAQLEAEQLLKQQTETFWLLQMQFMELTSFVLASLMQDLLDSGSYRANRHTNRAKKILDKVYRRGWDVTTGDTYCLATHLALQLAGVEE